MGDERFAAWWCRTVAVAISSLGLLNLFLGFGRPIDDASFGQHVFFTVASSWLLPPILLFAWRWEAMYAWYLRRCREMQPEVDDEYQTRLLVVVSGLGTLWSLYCTYRDYEVTVMHATSFRL